MKRLFFLFSLLPFISVGLSAQEKTDLQIRIPTHFQILPSTSLETENHLGLALWGILPNVTAPNNNLTTLVVGGLLWQYNKKDWVEVMAGSRMNQNGYVDPIFNLRLVNSRVPGLSIFGEIQQSFRKERKRTLYWLAVTTPSHIGNIRVGVETENVHFFGKGNSLSFGPEIVVPLPIKLPRGMKTSLTTTYQFRNGRNFVRVYVVTNFLVKGGG